MLRFCFADLWDPDAPARVTTHLEVLAGLHCWSNIDQYMSSWCPWIQPLQCSRLRAGSRCRMLISIHMWCRD